MRPCAIAVALWLCAAHVARAQSSAEAIDWAMPRLVKIYGAGGLANLETYGSGFLVSAEGHVVTVSSHLLDRNEVIVVLGDGRRFDARVVGLSSSVLFDTANPRNPINRRISIIVMNKRAEEAALQSDVPTAEAPRS